MVRLVQRVARCTPIGMQHATNAVAVHPAVQQVAQPRGVRHRESSVVAVQPHAQQACNERATSAVVFNPGKLRRLHDREDELRGLVEAVLADEPDEQAEAVAVALRDPDNALICLQSLLAERGAGLPAAEVPSEPTCRDCASLARDGRCLAAGRGESLCGEPGVRRDYSPAEIDRPLRCLAFKPRSDAADQRSGVERWPFLVRQGRRYE